MATGTKAGGLSMAQNEPCMEPEKLWQPEEPLAITLTMEQWATVRHCLIEVADANKAQVYF